jgi:DNA-binding IscR family transcriptional regulator
LPPLSPWQCRRKDSRSQQKRLPRVTACHRDISSLVRCGILKGIRGPRGGYELARDRRRVTANDILRAAGTVDEADGVHAGSDLLTKIVLPAMANAEQEFGTALARMSVEGLARDAQSLKTAPKVAVRN